MFIHDTHLTQISVVVVRVLFVYIYQAIDIKNQAYEPSKLMLFLHIHSNDAN